MRIAIAGTNGLAQLVAYYLYTTTSHNLIFLSRQLNPGLTKNHGWQVHAVSYMNPDSVVYLLRGVDLVISTLTGESQLVLINAAAKAQVRQFIPSAFSGPIQCGSPTTGNQEWVDTIQLLQDHEMTSAMRYTVFTCGIFYERFGPGGLKSTQISTSNGPNHVIGEEGKFLVDMRAGKTTIPVISGTHELAICLTSFRDVARYVVAALDVFENISGWPTEFRFFTERLTMSELREVCGRVKGIPLIPSFTTPAALAHALDAAQHKRNFEEVLTISQHLAVAQSHPAVSFPITSVNLYPDVLASTRTTSAEPAAGEAFESWLSRAWSTPTATPASSTTRVSTKSRVN